MQKYQYIGMRRQPLEHEISAVASERAELDAQAPEPVSSKARAC